MKKLKIKSIIINNEEIAVEQKVDNENGIKFYIKDQIMNYFDFKGLVETISLNMIKVRTDKNKIYSLFDCFYTIRGDNIIHEQLSMREISDLYIHLTYNIFVKEDVNEINFFCNKLVVELEYIKNLEENNFFENVSINLDNISIKYLSTKTKQKIIISSKQISNTEILFSYFISYLELISLIIGYFPNIIKKTYKFDKKTYIIENEIVSKYISAEKYKKRDLFIFKDINNEQFRESYIKYRLFSEKSTLPLSVYFFVMMKKPSYVDVDIVNILQALDGLYDKLNFFENEIEDYPKEMNDEIKDLIKVVDFSVINKKYKNDVDINEKINNCIERMNYFSYRKKLKNMFKYDNYIIFQEEKKKDNIPFIYYDLLVAKCCNSRNRLSHVDERENCLSAVESVAYIYKIILIFRLLVLEEIGLKNQIDNKLLNQHINLINTFIKEKLSN